MQSIFHRARIEAEHFQKMGANLQRMLLVFSFYLAASPMLQIFLTTYLWRQEGGALFVILYNLGFVFGLPVGFFINGYLLKLFHIKFLYCFGLIVQGLGAALAIFSTGLTVSNIALYGLLYGVMAGLFWANRNTLDFQLSREKNRSYFFHIQVVVASILDVVMPFVVGWLLVLGEQLGLYDVTSAYKALMVFALVLLCTGGLLVSLSDIPDTQPKTLRLPKASPRWWKVRFLNIFLNFMEGVGYFLPSFLILSFGSKEGVFGTVFSLSALITAGVAYILGRKTKIHSAPKTLSVAFVVYCAVSLFLAIHFSWLSVGLYLLVFTLTSYITFTSSYLIIMEVMDREDGVKDGKTDYAYVADNELFFNIGRAAAILLFLAAYFISFEGVLRWSAFAASLVLFLGIRPAKELVRSLTEK